MKGRAYQLLRRCLGDRDPPTARASFLYARVILRARVVPEEVTPDLDAPDIERRLENALDEISRGG